MPATQLTAGAGPDTLVLKISQDHYQGSARYTVSVDGKQVGGTFTASALRSRGEFDTDAWGGTAATDRNLFVEGAAYNGEAVPGAAKAFMSAGAQSFAFEEAA